MAQDCTEGIKSNTTPFTDNEVAGWGSWITELVEKFCDDDIDPTFCSATLERAVHRFHGEFNSRRRYLGALKDATRFIPQDRQPWGWHPLIDIPFLRVGLISMQRFFSIPLHDHPNAWGAQLIVSGKVRIKQYQLASDSNQLQTLVTLEQIADRVFVKGENISFTPSFRNLHELESISPRCVVLSMMVNPYKPQDRSLYYQVPLIQRANTGLYNRIRKWPAIREELVSKSR